MWGLDLSNSLTLAGGVGGLLTQVDIGSVKSYAYLYDGNGNVAQLIDNSDGSIDAHYEYDPYAREILSSGAAAADNPYRFSTKYQDSEYDLYYFGYRYYDPDTGRWLSRDPIGEQDTFNLYLYTWNNPVTDFDLLGLYSLNDAIASLGNCTDLQGREKSRCIKKVSSIVSGQQVFDEWFRLEELDTGWWKDLPKCPKKLECTEKGRPKKLSEEWNPPVKPSTQEKALHPGIEWSMRSVSENTDDPGNQCTYYSDNGVAVLFESYPSAGTVDFKKPGTREHFDHDVDPIYLADFLDGGGRRMTFWRDIVFGLFSHKRIRINPGENMNKYYKVRPLHSE